MRLFLWWLEYISTLHTCKYSEILLFFNIDIPLYYPTAIYEVLHIKMKVLCRFLTNPLIFCYFYYS